MIGVCSSEVTRAVPRLQAVRRRTADSQMPPSGGPCARQARRWSGGRARRVLRPVQRGRSARPAGAGADDVRPASGAVGPSPPGRPADSVDAMDETPTRAGRLRHRRRLDRRHRRADRRTPPRRGLRGGSAARSGPTSIRAGLRRPRRRQRGAQHGLAAAGASTSWAASRRRDRPTWCFSVGGVAPARPADPAHDRAGDRAGSSRGSRAASVPREHRFFGGRRRDAGTSPVGAGLLAAHRRPPRRPPGLAGHRGLGRGRSPPPSRTATGGRAVDSPSGLADLEATGPRPGDLGTPPRLRGTHRPLDTRSRRADRRIWTGPPRAP